MFGPTVSSGDAATAHIGDDVEVVPGDRIRPRALFRGQKFRLMSVDATRYRWHCSVSTCPSRLMTDKFGERHVLYSFKDHDEKEHLAMEERKRSNNKTYKSEVVEKIGEFMYVLERTTINIKCWRCQYVSNAAGSIGRTASVVEVLGMLSGSCACAENKLLAAIYEQVFALLHKEDKLLEVQMSNEVRRGRLLDLLMNNGPSEAGSNSNPPEGLYSVD
ncbi:hypothetical protein MTO96_051142 [Rhipicephalus appendiculatus]